MSYRSRFPYGIWHLAHWPIGIWLSYREDKMRSFVVLVLLMFSSALFAQQAVPEIPFDSVPNFFKLPADLHLGEASGVAVNSKGHVFVFNRGNTIGPAYAATAAQVLEFGPDGKYIREV